MTGTVDRLMEMAAATPASRDRYADFLRAFSISVVVLGHWLVAVVHWRDGRVGGVNALEVIDGLWILTWVLQVMPLFFFVGGFANLRSWEAAERRGSGYAEFLYTRLLRMMRPTAVFLAVGLAVITVLDAFNVADNAVFPASELIARPLWFLGVYMIVIALAPPMVWLHRRHGSRVVLTMMAVAVSVDVVRFVFDVTGFGYVNYPVVWLMAHQLGFFYGGGGLARLRWALATGGLVAMIGLVNLGPYPGSMVGLGRDEFSNMDPPTIAIAALALWEIGLALLLRPAVRSWLRRLRVWAGVIWVNTVIMTVFLWHLTAMLLGIGILYPLGWPQPEAGTVQWWVLRPVWVGALLAILLVLVLAFGRFEAARIRPVVRGSSGASAAAASGLGAVLLVIGVLGFAMGGMHQLFSETGTELIVFSLNPLHSSLLIALGGVMLRGSLGSPSTVGATSVLTAAALAAMATVGMVGRGSGAHNWLAANGADVVFEWIAAAYALGVAAVPRSVRGSAV